MRILTMEGWSVSDRQRHRFASLRILTLCFVMERSRHKKSAVELFQIVNQTMIWDWNVRTLRRDLAVLVDHGVVKRVREGTRVFYVWSGLSCLDPVPEVSEEPCLRCGLPDDCSDDEPEAVDSDSAEEFAKSCKVN